MTIQERLQQIKERAEKCATFPEATANLPFYVVMNKPRPSLSKHDSEQPTFWHPDDALFLIHAQQDVPKLLRVIEKLIEQRDEAYREQWMSEQQWKAQVLIEELNIEIEKLIRGDE